MNFIVIKIDKEGKEWPPFTVDLEGLITLMKSATPFMCAFRVEKIE